MRVLITGFEPFGGAETNASWFVAERDRAIAHAPFELVTARLPTSFDAAFPALDRTATQLGARHVIALGESSACTRVQLETNFVNRIDARIPDNAGARPVGAVVPDAPPTLDAFDATARDALARLAGVVDVSTDAGSFVCNALGYQAALALSRGRWATFRFFHVPVVHGLEGSERDAVVDRAAVAVLAFMRLALRGAALTS